MGTDIGAGTTFNMLQTLNEAYKVVQLQGYRLSAYEAFYLATLGGAKALGLDHLIGNFMPCKEADFVVLEPTATPLQQLRYDNSKSPGRQIVRDDDAGRRSLNLPHLRRWASGVRTDLTER